MKILAVATMIMNDGCKGIEGVEIIENIQDLNRFVYEYSDDIFDIQFDFYTLGNGTLYEFAEYSDVVDAHIAENEAMSLETTKLMLSHIPVPN